MIIVDNCTEMVVNFYQPELNTSMEINETLSTRVLLIRAVFPCYLESALITTNFLPVSFDPRRF